MASPIARTDPASVFRRFDKNGDGFIDRDDLIRVFRRLDPHAWTDQRIDALLFAADGDDDGKVHFEDFLSWLGARGSRDFMALPLTRIISHNGSAVSDGASPDIITWTRCERLSFSGTLARARYTLPLFVHDNDFGKMLLTDVGGRALSCYRDVVYEAVDHCLLWVCFDFRQDPSVLPVARVHIYSSPEHSEEEVAKMPSYLSFQQAEDTLLFADFFHGSPEDILKRWTVATDVDAVGARVSVSCRQDFGPQESISSPASMLAGQALCLDCSRGPIALRLAAPTGAASSEGRLHLRAHFWDDGEDHVNYAHWLGFKSRFGSGALGLAFGIDGEYSFLHGTVPSGARGEYDGWKRGLLDRSKGWHLLEILLEHGEMSMCIDGESLSLERAEGKHSCEEVWLVSRCGGLGLWAGVELFFTPHGENTWELGVQSIRQGMRLPWTTASQDEFRYQCDDSGAIQPMVFRTGLKIRVVRFRALLENAFSRVATPENNYRYMPEMDQMLGLEYEVQAVLSDGMVGLPAPDGSDEGIWFFPPISLRINYAAADLPAAAPSPSRGPPDAHSAPDFAAPAAPAAHASRRSGGRDHPPPTPSAEHRPSRPPTSGLSIECWSLPGEEELAKIERVVHTFLEHLERAGVALPQNVCRVETCPEARHAGCQVYNFGTRRLHVSSRETPEGRLLLVVRCGGGFVDFVQFARRHGSLERLRIERRVDPNKREVVHLTSVMASGRVKVTEGRADADAALRFR